MKVQLPDPVEGHPEVTCTLWMGGLLVGPSNGISRSAGVCAGGLGWVAPGEGDALPVDGEWVPLGPWCDRADVVDDAPL